MTGHPILIVEDEPDLREILVEELQARGCEVFQADDGPSAMVLLREREYRVIISDIRMPGFGGVDILRKLKAERTQIPDVVFITGFSDFSEEDVRALGAKAVFQKPFRIREIIAFVESLLAASASASQTKAG